MALGQPKSQPNRGALDRCFGLSVQGTNVRREVAAGLATFMTMAYIVFVNPVILAGAGMPAASVAATTCLGAALPCLAMGWWANYPLALASGMGLNAAVVAAASQPGMHWQTLMGVVVLEGLLVTLLVLSGIREQVMSAIPLNLKRSIGVGIGLFIAFLGLQQMGWVDRGPAGVLLAHGNFAAHRTLVAAGGLVLLLALLARQVRGALLLGILGTAAIAALADLRLPPADRLVHWPSSLWAWPDFAVWGQADLRAALQPALLGTVFAFLISDFFDTMGTVIAVGEQAGLLDPDGHLPRLNRVLLVDSLAAVWGGWCGCSSVTTYIESAAGVSAGGRTGLVAVVVGALFAAAMFLSPAAAALPGVATAPALVVVGFLMIRVIRDMDVTSADDGLPAFLTLILIPLTQSITTGIGVGFIMHVIVKVIQGRFRSVSPWLYLIASLFALQFALSRF